MKTGLLLITHGNIGRDMLDTVTEILGSCPLHAEAWQSPRTATRTRCSKLPAVSVQNLTRVAAYWY